MSIVDEVVIDGNVVTEKAVSFVGELVTRLVRLLQSSLIDVFMNSEIGAIEYERLGQIRLI